MGLTDSQKKHYAWEFWDSYQAALVSIKPKSKCVQRQRRHSTLEKNKIPREDARRAMGRWCISKIPDPNQSLDPSSIDALFRLLKPVTSFFDAPWPGDSRLYLAIDSY